MSLPTPTLFQRYYVHRERLGLSVNVACSATYSRPLFNFNDPLRKERLLRALRGLVARYEAFQVNIFFDENDRASGNDPVFHFERVDSIRFDDVVLAPPKELQEVTENYLLYVHAPEQRQLFGRKDRPLWRVHVPNEYTVTFAFCHAVFDGMAGALFHEELLKHYREALEEEEEEEGASPGSDGYIFVNQKEDNGGDNGACNVVPLCSAINVLDHTPGRLFLLKTLSRYFVVPKLPLLLQRLFVDPSKFSEPSSAPSSSSSSSSPRWSGSLFEVLRIPPDKLAAIVAWCKKEQISVTVLFIVALQHTLRAFLGTHAIDASVPVNLRPAAAKQAGVALSEAGGEKLKFGLFVAGDTLVFPAVDGTLSAKEAERSMKSLETLEACREVTKELQDAAKDGFRAMRSNVGMLGYVGDKLGEFITEELRKPKGVAVECSNLGLFRSGALSEAEGIAGGNTQGNAKGNEHAKENKTKKQINTKSKENGNTDINLDNLRVTDMVFSSSNVASGPVVTLYTVSTVEGGASLVFVAAPKYQTWLDAVEKGFLGMATSVMRE